MLQICSLLLPLFILPVAYSSPKKGPFISDRPGATDSPQTSERGKFRIEMTAFNHLRDDGATENGWAHTMIVGGLGLNTEFQLGNDGFIKRYSRGQKSISGFGDPIFRLKHNIWGNGGEEKAALGIMPFINAVAGSSTVGNDRVVYGLHLPFSWQLKKNFSLNLMPIWRRSRNQESDRYHNEGALASVINHTVADNLNIFFQLVTRSNIAKTGGFSSFYGGGTAYRLLSNLQLDVEINDGLNPDEDDFQVQAGFTYMIN